jgi:hypothetical protein
MEEHNKAEQLLKNVKSYLETRFDIIVLNLEDKVSDVLSSVATVLVLSVFSVLVVFFVSVGAAWWIGNAMQNSSIGFFIVGGFYLLLLIIVMIFKDQWIKSPLINILLKRINIHEND